MATPTTPTTLEIVRIPSDETTTHFMTVPLVNIGPGGISAHECKDIEKPLARIPNIKSLLDGPAASSSSFSFSWTHRRLLIGQPYKSGTLDTWSAVYMIYLCRESGAGLAPNERLNGLMRDLEWMGRATAMEKFESYGDAFVFRMAPKAKEEGEGMLAEYLDMPKTFISSALTDVRLRSLLMYPWSEE